ncbi:MAG: DUF1353 domain-containing protein [Campylobacteraceae bacterium]|jgi:hypothetical protein|nr:DUF1353 domain-containing protein [Campylobacteraceae bacterium]
MRILTVILGFFITWFSRPKKVLVISPVIKPCSDNKTALYEVVEDFAIHGFNVKKGTKTDGGSIPLFLCSIVGAHPFSPPIIAQCIGHDVRYDNIIEFYEGGRKAKNKIAKKAAMEAFKDADNWFYDALRLNNRRVRCKLFFWAVRIYSTLYFGIWKWYIVPIFKK